jgi:hypothetical protein
MGLRCNSLLSIPVSNQLCINWYPETESADSRNVITLQTATGIKIFVDIAASGIDHIRGMHFSEQLQLLFVVSGNELYDITSAGVKTLRGTIAGGTDVRMADNGAQVGIVNGLQYYVYTASTTTLADVKHSGGGDIVGQDIGFIDGRFVISIVDTQKFYITAVNAAQTVTSTDNADVIANPDNLAGLLVADRRIWFFGTSSFDVYFDSQQAAAAGSFPMIRTDGAAKNGYGLASLYGKVVQDGIPYWCSNDGRIYRANGYQPERISHYGIENTLRKYSKISDCQATQWTENGHRFVQFSFPAGGETWVFDATQGMWHQRSSGLLEKIVQECWDKRKICGSRSEDKTGEFDLDIFTEYGASMKVRRTSPVAHANQNVIFYNRLEPVFEAGRAQSGEDPEVALRWSDNAGATWGNYVLAKIGKIGEYAWRTVFYSLGSATNRVYDLQITDNVPRTLIDVVVDAEVGEV